jgi:hypothetical protein
MKPSKPYITVSTCAKYIDIDWEFGFMATLNRDQALGLLEALQEALPQMAA